jgi:hypothetical protein
MRIQLNSFCCCQKAQINKLFGSTKLKDQLKLKFYENSNNYN